MFDPDRPRTYRIKPLPRLDLTRRLSVANKLMLILPVLVMVISFAAHLFLAFTDIDRLTKWDRTLTMLRRLGAWTYFVALAYTIIRYMRIVRPRDRASTECARIT
jgi:hypothetical protein